MDTDIFQWIVGGLASAIAALFGVNAKVQSEWRAQEQKSAAERIAELKAEKAQLAADCKAKDEKLEQAQLEMLRMARALGTKERAEKTGRGAQS